MMCKNCATKGHIVCHMTTLQLACLACHISKTKCSYSALHLSCQEALISSGELQGKKASGKKKVPEGQESEVKGNTQMVVGKRKWPDGTAEHSGPPWPLATTEEPLTIKVG